MNRKIELPLTEPPFCTYNFQGMAGAIICNNPSIWNWYLNKAVNLKCTTKFLSGFTSPMITTENTMLQKVPWLNKVYFPLKYLGNATNHIIRELIDDGYYVWFERVDDYYIKGKSNYKERHFPHDALISGYDLDEKTLTIIAYDKDWIFRSFKTPMQCFGRAQNAQTKKGDYGVLYGIKVQEEQIKLDLNTIYSGLQKYLESSVDSERICGIVVHKYICIYLDKLLDQSIPTNRIDRRVFRMIWEHKKVMLKRIEAIESALNLGESISSEYSSLVELANHMRMLYVMFQRKPRSSILLNIKEKLETLNNTEKQLLLILLTEMEGKI